MAKRRRNEIAHARGKLYGLARLFGDVEAVRRGRIGKRLGRRVTGRAAASGLGKLFR